jgi:ornithine cyclodeaminase/alanine dehydrogenase-like protein (mu-crystallin family)
MKFFDSDSITNSTTIQEWIEAMTFAMQTSSSGDYIMPKRMHIDFKDNTLLLMPCITDEYWSTKLVSFYPRNNESGLPSIYGTLVLNSAKTGEPLAIMDGSTITAMRTAAVSAVGIKNLAPVNSRSLGIVGTGLQGIYQAIFACSVLKIDNIRAYDQSIHNLKRFSDQVSHKFPKTTIIHARDSSEVVNNSEVIITATNSQTPVFKNEKDLFTGKTFIGIGSYKPDCREFPEQLFRQTDQIFIDTPDGKKESGDLLDPVMNKWISEKNIYPIASLLSKEITLTSNPTKIFKTVGSAIYDLFAAKLVYEKHLRGTS